MFDTKDFIHKYYFKITSVNTSITFYVFQNFKEIDCQNPINVEEKTT